MSVEIKTKAGKGFWIIAALLLLWGLIGITMYMFEMTMDDAAYLESFGAMAMDLRYSVPTWAISGYALGVWLGLTGTVLLMLRKKVALQFYMVSFIGAVIGWSWYVFNHQARELMNEDMGWIMMAIVFWVCMFCIFYTRRKITDGTLN